MAEVFELHFNPRTKKEVSEEEKIAPDIVFDSFCYEPANVYEKRLGSLYIVGELKNTLPQNLRLLNRIAQIIKGKYYAFPIVSLEKNFEEGLKKINEFLNEELKKDNTSWLGNLNLSVISVKNYDLNFTSVGEMKVLLLRKSQVIDIGERLRFQEIEPYPLKIFGNIVSGKLSEGDQIIVLTKEVFENFSEMAEGQETSKKKIIRDKKDRKTIIDEIAQIKVEEKSYEKNLKKILKSRERFLSEISGVCLLILLTPEPLPKRTLTFEKEGPVFSIQKVFAQFIDKIKNIPHLLPKFPTLKKKEEAEPVKAQIPIKEKIKIIPKNIIEAPLKKVYSLRSIKFSQNLIKKLIPIFVLVLILFFGFLIFQREAKEQLTEEKINLGEIKEKVNLAESFLILKKEKEANSLFKEAWEQILAIAEKETPIKNEVLSLKNSIEENLNKLNKLEKISEPKLLSEFDPKDFAPQKIIVFEKEVYVFNPLDKKLFILNEKGEKSLIPIDQNLELGTTFWDSVLFFIKPDSILPIEKAPFLIKAPYPDYEFIDFSSFGNSIYFLDRKNNEIIKFPFKEDASLSEGETWLNPETKKSDEPKAFTIDVLIWVLNGKADIYRYFKGDYQETLTLDLFPYPKNFDKILTRWGLSYLYILEAAEKRIIVLSRTGEVIKQFQSEKFDNLKDFGVSADGKTIYLLNGQKVYQVQL